jgi:hypothetical protein
MSMMPLVVALLLAQSQPAAPPPKTDPNAPVTLNGCVLREASSDTSYTFTDSNGLKYRLTGKSVDKYSGMAVQVVGVVRKDVKITGGLWPTTNVAAQAGNMDPGKAAVIALGAGTAGTGRVELPTLRITRVGLGAGECKQ